MPTIKSMDGKAEVSLYGITIPAEMMSEVHVELVEGTRERTTLGGTFRKPSGTYETAQASFTLFLPSMDFLKNIFPGRYNAPTAPQVSGNVILGGSNCVTTEETPVNIHYTCDTNDNNDVHIFAAEPSLNFDATYNESDSLSIEVMLYAQPTDDGVARLGTGDTTEESIWDAVAGETVPVES